MLPMRCTIHTETYGHTRTHTDTHGRTRAARGRERGGRSERGTLREIARARERKGYGSTCVQIHSLSLSLTCTQGELKKFAGIRRDIEDGILSPEKLDAAKKEVGGCAVEKCAVVK